MTRSTRLIIIGLIVVGSVLYAFNMGNVLFWDDADWIVDNPVVQGLSWENTKFLFSHDILAGIGQQSNYYRPVLMLTFAVNWMMGAHSPFSYHLFNNILHIANAVLIFLLLGALLRHSSFQLRHSKIVSVAAALFWLIHPIQTESVAYISGRGDPLSVFLMLSAMAMFLRAREVAFTRLSGRRAIWLSGALLAAVLAILSRETAVLLPGYLLIVLMSFVYRERFLTSLWRSLKAVWPFIAISGIYTLLRLTALNFVDTLNWHSQTNVYTESILIRTWTFMGALFEYVRLAFLPVELHMEHTIPALASPFIWPVPLVAVLLAVVAITVIREWQRGNRIWFFALFMFLLPLGPASGIIVPINSLFYEHWLYLSLFGIAVLLAVYGVRLYEFLRKRAEWRITKYLFFIILTSYFLFLGVQTVRRNIIWGQTEKFYLQILHHVPDNIRVLNNLANLYADEEKNDLAEQYWIKASEVDSMHPAPYHNLGNLARDREQYDKAVALYLKAIQVRPSFHYAYRNLSGVYLIQKEYQKALDTLLILRNLSPADASVHYAIAQLYHSAGRNDLAREALEMGTPYLQSLDAAMAYEELFQKLQ
jgi:hypothetical protein